MGKAQFQHRTVSQTLSLDDALQAVGLTKLSSAPYENNGDLTAGAIHRGVIVVDWNFRASTSALTPGSLLNNPSPLLYDYTP